MKKIYIVIFVLIVLVVGTILIYGTGRNAKTLIGDAPVVGGLDVEDEIGEMADVKEFTVSATNFSFSPSTLTVNKGDRVKITFENTMGFHDFVIDDYGISTLQEQSPDTEVIEFTADQAGSFEYYCSVGNHREMGMRGTFIVN